MGSVDSSTQAKSGLEWATLPVGYFGQKSILILKTKGLAVGRAQNPVNKVVSCMILIMLGLSPPLKPKAA